MSMVCLISVVLSTAEAVKEKENRMEIASRLDRTRLFSFLLLLGRYEQLEYIIS